MSENNKNLSMFNVAHNRTLESMKYLVYQEKIKTDELNHLGQDVLENAKMEIYVAQIENVSEDHLSKPARMLLENPDLVFAKEFSTQLLMNEELSMEPKTAEEPQNTTEAEKTDDYDFEIFQKAESQNADNSINETNTQYKSITPIAFVKNFDCLKVANLPKDTSKIYRPPALKPCRELLYSIVTKYAMEQLQSILDSDFAQDTEDLAIFERKFATSSMVCAILKTLDQGISEKDIMNSPISSIGTQAALKINALSDTIIANAQEFKEDNSLLAKGKSLTAENITNYYRELGAANRSSNKQNPRNVGKAIISEALSSEVYSILDDASMDLVR